MTKRVPIILAAAAVMVFQSSCGLANNYYNRGVNMLMAPFRSASGVSGIPLADPTRAGAGLDPHV